MADPATILAGVSIAKGIYDSFQRSGSDRLLREVIADRRNFLSSVQKRARGELSTQQRQDVLAGAQPELETIQGNLAARGISQSGAGAQIAAGAVSDVFRRDREFAQQQLPQAQAAFDQARLGQAQMAQADDDAFFSDLEEIGGLYVQLQTMKAQAQGQGQRDADDEKFDLLMDNILRVFENQGGSTMTGGQ